jgi:transposase
MEQINLFNEAPSEAKAKKKLHNKVTFKEYQQEQMMLPTYLSDIIPQNHVVRVVNDAIERMDIAPLLSKYEGGGTSSFHPKMMLKVLVYAYIEKIFSSRKIAKALKENINFMWISGGNWPDHRTLNRFRSTTLKGAIDQVFSGVLELLLDQGYIKFENYFMDGTKIEANANKYTFVWGKSVEKNRKKLQEKVKGLLEQIDELNDKEDQVYGNDAVDGIGKEPISPDKLAEMIQALDEKLVSKPADKQIKKAVKTLKDDCLPRMKKYEEHEKNLNGRNNYCKTDIDATFMRMKEDHMKNGQLKPGYNVQIGTEGQFILGYSIHQSSTDTVCMEDHLNHVAEMAGKLPETIIADAGYGSEENYEYLEGKRLNNYVKYNMFHPEQKRSFKKQKFRYENFQFDSEKDEFICPANQRLTYRYTYHARSKRGYQSTIRVYEAEHCNECPFHEQCTKSKENRKIRFNPRLEELKVRAKINLTSEKGLKLRSLRAVEVESVFGRIKSNWGFRRFLLRGLEKVNIEWGLLSIAHNMAKMAVTISN